MAGGETRGIWVSLGRAYGGAMLFSLPLLMTMEMWWLGFMMERSRLVILLIAFIPILARLARYIGFEKTVRWTEHFRAAFIALWVGFSTSAAILWLLAAIGPDMDPDEVLGQIAVQAVPASIGAMLARSELGSTKSDDNQGDREPGYLDELFLMMVGALFLAFNLAPTEEMVLLAYQMDRWLTLALALLSILVMHAFVYVVEFKGHHGLAENQTHLGVALRFTVAGYGLALLVSAYILWTFGRMDGVAPGEVVETILVLGFPAAIGAASARLVL